MTLADRNKFDILVQLNDKTNEMEIFVLVLDDVLMPKKYEAALTEKGIICNEMILSSSDLKDEIGRFRKPIHNQICFMHLLSDGSVKAKKIIPLTASNMATSPSLIPGV